jgi:hypothetical protein
MPFVLAGRNQLGSGPVGHPFSCYRFSISSVSKSAKSFSSGFMMGGKAKERVTVYAESRLHRTPCSNFQ